MNNTEQQILNLLEKTDRLRSVQISKTLKIGFHNVYPALQNLRRQGLIKATAESRYIFYQIAAAKQTNEK